MRPSTFMGREPVLTMMVVRSALLAGIAFGLRLDAGQVAAIMLVTESLLGWLTRSRVTPAGPEIEPE